MSLWFNAARICVLLFALTPAVAQASSQTPPDIVVILADDLGYSDLGCYGSEIETPNLDALASRGARFTQFYNTSRCCPSRASLLTGLWPHQAEMGWMTSADMGRPGYRNQLSESAPTIAERLKAGGYDTYMVGKWHLTHTDEVANGPNGSWPMERGFDHWYGTVEGAKNYFRPKNLFRDRDRIEVAQLPRDYFYTDALGEAAAGYVEQQARDRPLFLYVAFFAPHFPLQAPEATVRKFRGRYLDGWAAARKARFERQRESEIALDARLPSFNAAVPDWDSLTEAQRDQQDLRMATYAAQVHVMDRAVGKVVAALERAGRLDNTLILFMSDNGCPGRGGPLGKGPTKKVGKPSAPVATINSVGWADVSNTPFRLYKTFAHEGGVRTPLIAHWPSQVDQPGSLRRVPGHLVDIMPTVLAAAGIEATADGEGIDLLPVLRNRKVESSLGDRAIYFEHEGRHGLRSGQWKLVAKRKAGPFELYDMREDPAELRDLAGSKPGIVARLTAMWRSWAERCNVLPLDSSSWNRRIKLARRRK